MTTARGWAYTAVAVASPFVALGLGDPAPVVVGFPFMVVLLLGVFFDQAADTQMELVVDAVEGLEGCPVAAKLSISARGRSAHVTMDLAADVAIESVEGARQVGEMGLVVPLVDGQGTATMLLRPSQWGAIDLGAATVTVPGPLRVRLHGASFPASSTLVVLPSTEEVRRLVEPLATNMHIGDLRSKARGPGFEFAELRQWAPGDSPRSINWRASARSSETWVTQRHADRSGDLILVVDSVVESNSEAAGVLEDIVRLAASLVETYGQARHRLGLMSLGGHVRWFGLGSGPVHQHRLLEALLRTQAVSQPVWTAVDRMIGRALSRPAMIVLVSSLLDDGLVGRAMRMSRSGMDVVAIEADPLRWIGSPSAPGRRLARRIWQLERAQVRHRLRASGVATARWEGRGDLHELMEEVEEWRRRLRRVPV